MLMSAAMVIGLVGAQGASAASQTINSPNGPLTNIWLGDTFTCQVEHAGESAFQFYPPGSQAGNCGTWLSLDSTTPEQGPQLYGPFLSGTQFSNPAQSGVTGDGSPNSPYSVTTSGDAGSSGVHISQTDSYVACADRTETGDCVGNEYYRTDITVTNNSLLTASGRLYHAADCYLQGSDSGYGYVDSSSNAVACSQNPNNDPQALIEEFAPLTGGAHYLETGFSANFSAVNGQGDLPDTCDCDVHQDNGMSVNWDFSLGAGESKTFSMLSNFSSSGVVAPNHNLTVTGGRSFSGDVPLNVNGAVADFSDSVPDTTPDQYSASIDWGDSTSSSGSISPNGNGGFTVNGDHTYEHPGSYTVTVTVSVNGNPSQASATDSATVTHKITATGGRSFSGDAPATFNATLATFTDSASGTAPSDYAATIDWGDSTPSSSGTIQSNGNGGFTVTGSHTYNNPGSYKITVTITAADGHANSPSVTDSATVRAHNSPAVTPTPPPSRPAVVTQQASSTGSTNAELTGSVNPGGLPTTIHWEYGLDPAYRGAGFSSNVYDQRTADVPVGSGSSDQPVSQTVGNLQPNAVYHYRLVASNSDGTTFGQDQTLQTASDTPPSTPVVGQSGNFSPAGGTVFVLINGQFVKLTEVRQLPNGTVVDALHGSLKLTVASGQNIASAGKRKTYTGTFGGAVFKVHQNRTGPDRGLTTLSIVEGAFKGAPSYAACKKAGAARVGPRALSSRVLQSLRSRASGRFRTRGRYAAATVRGTGWTTVDRCDGTLVSVQLHSVLVRDLVRHISLIVRAGHRYFASAKPSRPPRPARKPPFTG